MSHSFNRQSYYNMFLLLKDVDECSIRPNVCKNGGTCTNAFGGYSCICVNGWTGKNCETNFDDCAGAACLNGNSFLLKCNWIIQGTLYYRGVEEAIRKARRGLAHVNICIWLL